jgi:hypothetical protein
MIKVKPLKGENQGIQYRARFFFALGIGRWWKIGIGYFSYDDQHLKPAISGGWFEIMAGWWRVLFTFPGDLL